MRDPLRKLKERRKSLEPEFHSILMGAIHIAVGVALIVTITVFYVHEIRLFYRGILMPSQWTFGGALIFLGLYLISSGIIILRKELKK